MLPTCGLTTKRRIKADLPRLKIAFQVEDWAGLTTKYGKAGFMKYERNLELEGFYNDGLGNQKTNNHF